MTGKRPLSDAEYNRVEQHIRRHNPIRDLTMIMLCRYTGYRIKEVLSVKVSDLYRPDGSVRESLLIMPRNMKKKTPRMPIHICEDLSDQLQHYRDRLKKDSLFYSQFFLIQSQKGDNTAISYTQAYRIIKAAFDQCGVYDNVAVHSLRKSFCDRVYVKSGFDLKTTQSIMGHSTIKTTEKYISVNNKKVNQTMEQLWI